MKPMLLVGVVLAMLLEPTVEPFDSFAKDALTQGGLFSLVLVLGWSYRRDFMRMEASRGERITVLTDLVRKATEAQTKTADAVGLTASAITAQANSIQQMAVTLVELKSTLLYRRDA